MTIETAMVRYNQHQIPDTDWNAVPLRCLIRHIVETHHAYLQTELPALEKLLGKNSRQGKEGPLLRDLQRVIQHLKRDLELQMRKEETIVFPAVAELEAIVEAGGRMEHSQFGSMANLSRITAQDHDRAMRAIQEIRQVTGDYTCGKDCEPYMPPLFSRLANLASDLHRHFHLEKNILFPRAVDLEKRGMTRCQ